MQFELPFRAVAWITPGTRAAEEELLDRIQQGVDEGRRDPALLAQPMRVIVPSKSMRLAVSAAIVRRVGRSVLGVVVQSLFGAAYEILEQGGQPVRTSGGLVDVIVRRAAREEVPLREVLDPLVNGYGSVRRSVRELLDAGFQAEDLSRLLPRLDRVSTLGPGERRRAISLLRTAAATDEGLADRGLDRGSTVLRRAARRLRTHGAGALPSRAVILHGFDGVDGLSGELLEQLARHPRATAILNHPPDPAAPLHTDVGAALCRPLTDRLGRATGGAREAAPRVGPPQLRAFVAEGPWGEANEVGRRVASLLEEAVEPEQIGVVARDLGAWSAPLRVVFGRLGIPWSGVAGLGPARPAVKWRSLPDLLVRGEALSTDAWLELRACDPTERADLRLALRSLGAVRLSQAAQTSLRDRLDAEGQFRLPVQEGLEEGEDGPRSRRRRLDGAVLTEAIASAARLVGWCQAWPARAELRDATERLRELVEDVLGAEPDSEPGRAVARLAERYDPTIELHTDEIALLLADTLRSVGETPIGGRGGGVQVLSANEARGRTFQHLFVLGLNRGSFPPPAPDDALLTPTLRTLLRAELPSLALPGDAFFAERYRFAGLLSSAPQVTLSWQSVDGDGKIRAVSPLVERMRWEGMWPDVEGAVARTQARPGERRAPADHALVAALTAPRRTLTAVLTEAIEDARGLAPHAGLLPSAKDVAEARWRVVGELDPDLSTDGGLNVRSRPGPYLGLLGPAGDGDPRRRDAFVSLVEAVATCPWQALLTRMLRVERVPDPLAAVPQADARIRGMLVHRILECIVQRAVPRSRTVADALRKTGGRAVPVPWPNRTELGTLARVEAVKLLRDEGISLPGLAEMLARQIRPLLEVALRMDWGDGDLPAIATEVSGQVTVGDRTLHFRADRVDLRGDRVVLTDYKVGKPFAWAATTFGRRGKHLDEVTGGRRLQASVYAAADGLDRKAEGRFLYLKPEVEDGPRSISAVSDDFDFRTALDHAVGTTLGAVEGGVMFPRLVDPTGQREPRPCSYCRVAEACLRGDSGVRGRMVRWSQSLVGAVEDGAEVRSWERRFTELWQLPNRSFEAPEDEWGF
ncbi:MAG: hypothetical protein GY898_13970 [Proteobacteria bacterium]|nr:hypothetical protein [Pseudomonadota bacterium]